MFQPASGSSNLLINEKHAHPVRPPGLGLALETSSGPEQKALISHHPCLITLWPAEKETEASLEGTGPLHTACYVAPLDGNCFQANLPVAPCPSG